MQALALHLYSRSIPAWTGEPTTFSIAVRTLTVYPRVDGGTPHAVTEDILVAGLSPRGRGNRTNLRAQVLGGGSIPAWTGEPVT